MKCKTRTIFWNNPVSVTSTHIDEYNISQRKTFCWNFLTVWIGPYSTHSLICWLAVSTHARYSRRPSPHWFPWLSSVLKRMLSWFRRSKQQLYVSAATGHGLITYYVALFIGPHRAAPSHNISLCHVVYITMFLQQSFNYSDGWDTR
jgi:hypothetical protein